MEINEREMQVGMDYGFVFGLDPRAKGQHMIYNGGDSWTMQERERSQTIESQGTTAKVKAYITQPSVMMGLPR